MSILIFGHKNPDTDTICSAIAYSKLKNKLGIDAKPVRLGEINEETKYVIDYFNMDIPEIIENVAGKEIILVDHNERTQTANGFEEAKVLELIDHHRISNFNVDEPLIVRMEPVGCTSTIIFKMFKENNIVPSKEVAGLMLSAIISDTLLFKSPTCTEYDVKAGKELSFIAEVDLEKYGLEMLKAGTNLGNKSNLELLNMDMKIFEIDKTRIGVSQVNTVNESEVLEKKESLITEINNIIDKEGLKTFIFIITNILSKDSTGIVVGKSVEVVEKAFGEKIYDNLITLKGVVSRKKQVIPPLTKAIQEA